MAAGFSNSDNIEEMNSKETQALIKQLPELIYGHPVSREPMVQVGASKAMDTDNSGRYGRVFKTKSGSEFRIAQGIPLPRVNVTHDLLLDIGFQEAEKEGVLIFSDGMMGFINGSNAFTLFTKDGKKNFQTIDEVQRFLQARGYSALPSWISEEDYKAEYEWKSSSTYSALSRQSPWYWSSLFS